MSGATATREKRAIQLQESKRLGAVLSFPLLFGAEEPNRLSSL